MNCPFCNKYYDKKSKVLDHMERVHGQDIDASGMDAAQNLYFASHGTIHGICMCGCGKETDWNYKTGKPARLTKDPNCKKRLAELADRNYRRTHGISRGQALQNMEEQKRMQIHRPSGGEYTFKDGGKVRYLSKLELAFLQFNDKIMELPSSMVMECPFTFTYYDPRDKRERSYNPDFWLPDYNLIVECKEGGNHPNTNPAYIEETKFKESLKDEVMKKQTQYNYIKVVDNNFGPYLETLYHIVADQKSPDPKKNAVIVITESACMDMTEIPLVNHARHFSDLFVIISKNNLTGDISNISIAESSDMVNLYTTDNGIVVINDLSDNAYDEDDLYIFRYIGDDAKKDSALDLIIQEAGIGYEAYGYYHLIDRLNECGIHYHFSNIMKNHPFKNDFVFVGYLKNRKDVSENDYS